MGECKEGFKITEEIIELDKLKAKVFKYITYKKRTVNEIRQKFANENQNLLEDIIEYFNQNQIEFLPEPRQPEVSVSEAIKHIDTSIGATISLTGENTDQERVSYDDADRQVRNALKQGMQSYKESVNERVAGIKHDRAKGLLEQNRFLNGFKSRILKRR